MGTQPEQGFGALLRRFRVAAGMSQELLAERAGISVDAVAALERGRRTRPRAFTISLLADALRLDPGEREALVAARSAREEPRFPAELTSFVGRERDLVQLRALLGRARLLTLVGAGGIGKTRLALALARSASGKYRDGAWFVALDSLQDPALVPQTVAAALGVREEPGRPIMESLLAWLGGRETLLVLDNCEHLAETVAAVAEAVLQASPGLRLLATSRSVLHVSGEMIWPVAPLADKDAASLFEERAVAVSQGFRLDAESIGVVARLSRRLDGIPLAIELAAAQARVLTPEQILAGVEDPLRLAAASGSAAVPRHRTLEATVDWSYRLLEPAGRLLFDRLAVFSGGFDLDAADAVHGDPALGQLAYLIDASLVVAEPSGSEMRYRLLEVLRQYASARLDEHGEADEMRDRHAEHCLALARRADAGFRGGERGLWRARLRLERDNFRLALAWTRARRMDLGLRLAALLARFWTQEGWVREGRSWLESMLAEGTDDPDLLATATGRAGDLAYLDADYAAARSWLEQSLALKREFDDQLGVARRLGRLSAVAMAAGEGGAAEGLAGEALEIHRRLGDPRGIAWANLFLGWAAQVACDGRLAADSFQQALTMHRSLGETDGIAYDLMGLTGVALEAGDVASARHRFAEAAPLIVGPLHGVPADPGWLWAGLVLAEAEGRDRAALRLAGAADARARAGVRWNEALRVRYQPVVDRARLRAGAAEAGRLITEGAEMSVEELVAVALERVG